MPKAMDFASISMRVPPGSREWTSRSGLIAQTGIVDDTHCLSGRRSPAGPSCAVERRRGCGIEGLRCSSARPRIMAGAYSR
jgi:hypothetical protein